MAALGPSSTVTSTTVPLTVGACGPSPASSVPVRSASSTAGEARRRAPSHPRLAFSLGRRALGDDPPMVEDDEVLARRSASSRYWVVSSTVVPPLTNRSMTPQRSLRLWGSRPVVGSSRKRTGGPRHQCGGQVEAPPHASGVGLEGAVGGVGQVELVEQVPWPRRRLRRREVVEPADHVQVLAPGEVLVDGGVLAGQTRSAPRTSCGCSSDVVTRAPGPRPRRAGGWS